MYMCVTVLLEEHCIFSEQYRILQISYKVIHIMHFGDIERESGRQHFKHRRALHLLVLLQLVLCSKKLLISCYTTISFDLVRQA